MSKERRTDSQVGSLYQGHHLEMGMERHSWVVQVLKTRYINIQINRSGAIAVLLIVVMEVWLYKGPIREKMTPI